MRVGVHHGSVHRIPPAAAGRHVRTLPYTRPALRRILAALAGLDPLRSGLPVRFCAVPSLRRLRPVCSPTAQANGPTKAVAGFSAIDTARRLHRRAAAALPAFPDLADKGLRTAAFARGLQSRVTPAGRARLPRSPARGQPERHGRICQQHQYPAQGVLNHGVPAVFQRPDRHRAPSYQSLSIPSTGRELPVHARCGQPTRARRIEHAPAQRNTLRPAPQPFQTLPFQVVCCHPRRLPSMRDGGLRALNSP